MKTSYYANLRNLDLTKNVPVAISGDEGKLAGFEGKGMRKLSPYPFFKIWKAREVEIERAFERGKIDFAEYAKLKEENQNDYIQKFYEKVLKPQDPAQVFEELGENAVLVCFEKPTEFCHRFLVASWLEMSLGVKIEEAGFEREAKVQENKQNLKQKLQTVMEKDRVRNQQGKE